MIESFKTKQLPVWHPDHIFYVAYQHFCRTLGAIIPNFKVACIDIECTHKGSKFPDANRDQCIMIQVQLYGLFSQTKKKDVKTIIFIYVPKLKPDGSESFPCK